MTPAELADYVRAVVDDLGELTDAQRTQIAALLRPPAPTEPAGTVAAA